MDYKINKQKQLKNQLEHNKELVKRSQIALNKLAEEQIKILGKLELIEEIIHGKNKRPTT